MTANHRLAIELIQKTVDRRRNLLANLQSPDSDPSPENLRKISKTAAGILSYEESIRVLTGDELGKNSEGAAYERWNSDPVDNGDRAGWALEAVKHYALQNRFGDEAVIEAGDTEHLDEVAGDLVNDLCHLLQQSGLDPAVVLERGIRGYEVELAEENQPAECARCGDPISEADDAATDEVCGDCKRQIEDAGGEIRGDFPWAKDVAS